MGACDDTLFNAIVLGDRLRRFEARQPALISASGEAVTRIQEAPIDAPRFDEAVDILESIT